MERRKNLEQKIQAVFMNWIKSQDRVSRMISSFETNGHDGIHEPGHEYKLGKDGIVRCRTNPGYKVPLSEHLCKESYIGNITGSMKLPGDLREDFDEVFFCYSILDPFGYGYVASASLYELRGGNTRWIIWENYSELEGYRSMIIDGKISNGLRNALNSVYITRTVPEEVLDDIMAHLLALDEAMNCANEGARISRSPHLSPKRFEMIKKILF